MPSGRHRDASCAWRWQTDGKYSNAANDPEYNKKYYERVLKHQIVICDKCGCDSLKTNVSRHQHTTKCKQSYILRCLHEDVFTDDAKVIMLSD
jgi:hypothetical protein